MRVIPSGACCLESQRTKQELQALQLEQTQGQRPPELAASLDSASGIREWCCSQAVANDRSAAWLKPCEAALLPACVSMLCMLSCQVCSGQTAVHHLEQALQHEDYKR